MGEHATQLLQASTARSIRTCKGAPSRPASPARHALSFSKLTKGRALNLGRHVCTAIINDRSCGCRSHSDAKSCHRSVAKSLCGMAAAAAFLVVPANPALAATSPSDSVSRGNLVGQVAGLFGGGGDVGVSDDPVDPFTLYGVVYKKYVIEVLQGEKVLSRKRGFTVTTCASTIPANEETPAFNSLPIGERVFSAAPYLCTKRESQDLAEACSSACSETCERQLDSYDKATAERSGFAIPARLRAKVIKSGTRQCNYECNKQGKSSTFVVPARNY